MAATAPEPRSDNFSLFFEWPAPSHASAVVAAIANVERVGLRVLRVEATDWVTAQEIADRVERSRETVRLWSLGRLGPGGFPPPLNPGHRMIFYSWAEVSAWLRQAAGVCLPDEEPVLVVANLLVQLRELTGRLNDDTIWRLAPPQLLRRLNPEIWRTRVPVRSRNGDRPRP